MPLGQIGDMDVVPHAGAVIRIVIIAIDLQLVQPANRHPCDIGYKIIWNAHRVFADLA